MDCFSTFDIFQLDETSRDRPRSTIRLVFVTWLGRRNWYSETGSAGAASNYQIDHLDQVVMYFYLGRLPLHTVTFILHKAL